MRYQPKHEGKICNFPKCNESVYVKEYCRGHRNVVAYRLKKGLDPHYIGRIKTKHVKPHVEEKIDMSKLVRVQEKQDSLIVTVSRKQISGNRLLAFPVESVI